MSNVKYSTYILIIYSTLIKIEVDWQVTSNIQKHYRVHVWNLRYVNVVWDLAQFIYVIETKNKSQSFCENNYNTLPISFTSQISKTNGSALLFFREWVYINQPKHYNLQNCLNQYFKEMVN